MNNKKFQFIQGSAQPGEVATIKFMDSVNAWTVSSFKEEFDWLENYVKPSKIKILINSEGGSVLRGMNAFSAIMNSSIPTECIVEGLAASMGSVLLAAGDVSKMRDYGIIMIHNPFYGENPDDPMVVAFKKQLKTIYKQRWGFSDEKITEIMDGKESEDGTYLDADAAVELGIIAKENIIKTPAQKKAEIQAKLDGIESRSKFAEVFAGLESEVLGNVEKDENKPSIEEKPNINKDQNDNNFKNDKGMNENLASVAATLSMDKEATPADVLARVVELNKVEAKVAGLEQVNSELTIANTGLQTSLDNVSAQLTSKETELESVKAELGVFKQKEADAIKAEQEAFVDAAIKAGKITAESKEQWLVFAESNFETCKATIDGIVGKTKISDEIVAEAGKEKDVNAQLTDGEKAAKAKEEKVKAVAGDVEFQKIG